MIPAHGREMTTDVLTTSLLAPLAQEVRLLEAWAQVEALEGGVLLLLALPDGDEMSADE
jgi:hypothetical protein